MSAVPFFQPRVCRGDKPEHHFFGKLFTPFLVVVIDIGTKHNLLFSNRLSQGLLFLRICYMKNGKLRLPLRRFYFFTKALAVNKRVGLLSTNLAKKQNN